MPIKLVTQANLTDCGLACVAMVTGKSLDAVLRVAIKECGYRARWQQQALREAAGREQ